MSAFSASFSDFHQMISLKKKRAVMYQSPKDKPALIQADMFVVRKFRLSLKYKKKALNDEISHPASNEEVQKNTDQKRTKKLERFHKQCHCHILDLRWQMYAGYVEIIERSLSASIESLLLQRWLWWRVMRSRKKTTKFKATFYTVYCQKKKKDYFANRIIKHITQGKRYAK